ncbi:hypothetical protein EXIGLDRAFT_774456 [Exidia glandulosa HHB12029]|uniref:Uncharacterized protein n=1 Tax=Exidia glandulosa HHB12029 TaxID=1314781 RepID=A0A165ED02_EXIGL|nr:hypothetical protein EXIGLDRAFT_774456 [Exidia glandulosa HHB12029]
MSTDFDEFKKKATTLVLPFAIVGGICLAFCTIAGMVCCCCAAANRRSARTYVPARQAAVLPGAPAPTLPLYATPPSNTYHYALQVPAQPERPQQTHARAPSREELLPPSPVEQAPAYAQAPAVVHPPASLPPPASSPFPALPSPAYAPQQQLYPPAPAARPLSFDEAYSLSPSSPSPAVALAPTGANPFPQAPPPHYSQY